MPACFEFFCFEKRKMLQLNIRGNMGDRERTGTEGEMRERGDRDRASTEAEEGERLSQLPAAKRCLFHAQCSAQACPFISCRYAKCVNIVWWER